MRKAEDFLLFFIFSSVVPIFFFMAGWWGSIGLVPENLIFIIAIIGLVLGIVLDFLFLKKQLKNVYETDRKILIIIYLFYSIGMFGFFMGVPIFNLMIGILAGMFIGRRSYQKKEGSEKFGNEIRKTCVFTTAVMIAISMTSAVIALKDPLDTARNLEGMFNQRVYSITRTMILLIIVLGGFLLALAQYLLTKVAGTVAYHSGENQKTSLPK